MGNFKVALILTLLAHTAEASKIADAATPYQPEINKIPLVQTQFYDPENNEYRGLKESINQGAIFIAGAARQKILNEVEAQIRETLSGVKLKKYFENEQRRNQFIHKIVTENANHALTKVTNETAMRTFALISNAVASAIIYRVMTVEGVKDKARIRAWQKHILTNLNNCFNKTRTFEESRECVSEYQPDIEINTGLATGIELIAQEVAPAHPDKSTLPELLRSARSNYGRCIIEKKEVQDCVLTAVRKAILTTADATIDERLNSIPNNKVEDIKTDALPKFEICLNQAKAKGPILACLDQITLQASTLASEQIILNHPKLKEKITADDLPDVAKNGGAYFKDCMSQLARDTKEPGTLKTRPCELQTENNIIYSITVSEINDAITENVKSNPEAKSLYKSAVFHLDSCWKKGNSEADRERCLKSTIKHTATKITLNTIARNVTPELRKSNWNKRTAKWTKIMDGCLEKNLPNEITTAQDIKTPIYRCVAETSGSVAAAEIEMQATKHLGDKKAIEVGEAISNKYFIPCLKAGKTVGSDEVDKCSGILKVEASKEIIALKLAADGEKYLGSSKSLNEEKEAFIDCANKSQGKEVLLNFCIKKLEADATRHVTSEVVRKEVKSQLSESLVETVVSSLEEKLDKCLTSNISFSDPDGVNKCVTSFILGIASEIGAKKIEKSLKPLLGSKLYAKAEPALLKSLDKFNACLAKQKNQFELDLVQAAVKQCGDQLEASAIAVLRNEIRDQMTQSDSSNKEKELYNLIAIALPCLDGLMPADELGSEVASADPEGTLKGLLGLIGNYIRYDIDKAGKAVPEVLAGLLSDLKAAGPLEARRKLLTSLVESGFIDQLLKATVKDSVESSFKSMAKADRLPSDLEKRLISKENLDRIFSGDNAIQLRKLILTGILDPVLIQNASMKSPAVEAAEMEIRKNVAKVLATSPGFGEPIITTVVQKKIDNMGSFTHFFATLLYGSEALDWSKVRTTNLGKEAEEYIRNQILYPKFLDEKIMEAEEAKRFAKAEDLVKKAVTATGDTRSPAAINNE